MRPLALEAGENGALFSPQGGLRISARDLARVGRMLLNGGTLDGVRILSPASVETLLTPLWTLQRQNGDTDKGFYCSYGLATSARNAGSGCRTIPAGDGVHGSATPASLWPALGPVDRPRHGTGVAYFVTGLAADPPRGRSAFRAAEERAFRSALRLSRRRR